MTMAKCFPSAAFFDITGFDFEATMRVPYLANDKLFEQMPEFVFLCFQITFIGFVRRNFQGNAMANLKSIAFDPDNLTWIVGHQTDRRQPQIHEDLRADSVLPEIRLKSQCFI